LYSLQKETGVPGLQRTVPLRSMLRCARDTRPMIVRKLSAARVIAGLDPAIHHLHSKSFLRRRWTRGSSPRVTTV